MDLLVASDPEHVGDAHDEWRVLLAPVLLERLTRELGPAVQDEDEALTHDHSYTMTPRMFVPSRIAWYPSLISSRL